jgi:hypothetical protein
MIILQLAFNHAIANVLLAAVRLANKDNEV